MDEYYEESSEALVMSIHQCISHGEMTYADELDDVYRAIQSDLAHLSGIWQRLSPEDWHRVGAIYQAEERLIQAAQYIKLAFDALTS